MKRMDTSHGYINSRQLKIIAAVSMLIDHTAYLLLGCGVQVILSPADPRYGKWYLLYRAMRTIGRIAFPVYAFLLTEGIVHTRSWKKYALRLSGFALLSEIPFDLLCEQKFVALRMQNVFFTLLIALLTIKAAEGAVDLVQKREFRRTGQITWLPSEDKYLLIWMTATGLGCVAAMLLRTDYKSEGVFLIVMLYVLRRQPLKKCMIGFLWMSLVSGKIYYIWGFAAAFFLIGLYNGEPGSRRGKYAFYLFYPVHILLLYGIFRACLDAWLEVGL